MAVILKKLWSMQNLHRCPSIVFGNRMMTTPMFCMRCTCLVGPTRPQSWHSPPGVAMCTWGAGSGRAMGPSRDGIVPMTGLGGWACGKATRSGVPPWDGR